MDAKAFYVLLDRFPSPALPLFRQTQRRPYKLQIQDASHRVVGFVDAQGLDASRILEVNPTETIKSELGSKAALAIAFSASEIVGGGPERLRRHLRKMIGSNGSRISPFDLLEFSFFIGDAELIRDAAIRCKQKLELVSPSIVGRWIEGSPLDTNIKAILRSENATATDELWMGDSIEEIPGDARRIGLSGPYRLMQTINMFAEEQTETGRSHIVRDVFEGDDILTTVENASRALHLFFDEIQRLFYRSGRYTNEASRISRGTTYAVIKNYDNYRTSINNFSAVMSSSEKFSTYQATPFFSPGEEHLNFVIVCCHMIRTYPNFLSYMENKSPR